MITRLDIVILRDVLLFTLVCALGLTFLFSALSLYQIVNRFEVTPHIGTLMSFAPSLWVSLLPLTMPISALLAATLVYGRMRAEQELLLLAAAGVSPWRPYIMVIPLGVITAAISWFGVSEFGPDAYAQRHSLQRQALADFIDNPPQGARELRFPGGGGPDPSIDISYADVDAGRYVDLRILVYNDMGLLASLSADSATISYQRHSGIMTLANCFNPRVVMFDPDNMMQRYDANDDGEISRTEFREHWRDRNADENFDRLDKDDDGRIDRDEAPKPGRPVGTPLVARKVNELRVPFDFGSTDRIDEPKALGTAALIERIKSDRDTGKSSHGAAAEFVRRGGLTLAGLLLPLLGALIASLVNHPNRLMAIGAGVIPSALAYYPAMTASASLAESATLHPGVALALVPGCTLVVIGAVLAVVMRGRGA